MKVFISYSHEDKAYLKSFEDQLSMMHRNGEIETWTDREIVAGEDWGNEIDQNLERANIVIILVSPSFLSSNYCFDIELKRAIEKHTNNEAILIPILVRSCDWQSAPFSKIQCLPNGVKPIKKWDDEDEAWLDVVKGIRESIKKFHAKSRKQPLQINLEESVLNEKFRDWLVDTEVQLTHRNVDRVTLPDIYVPPHVKPLLVYIDEIIKPTEIIDVLREPGVKIFFGDEQSGKTSIAKYVFKERLASGEYPIFIDGKSISSTDLESLIKTGLREQYEKINLANFMAIQEKTLIISPAST